MLILNHLSRQRYDFGGGDLLPKGQTLNSTRPNRTVLTFPAPEALASELPDLFKVLFGAFGTTGAKSIRSA